MEAVLNAAFKDISLLENFALLFTPQKTKATVGPCKFIRVGHDSYPQSTYM